MPILRKSADRGVGAHGWLNSRHTFSFADYFDPRHSGFHNLLVINEDRVAGGRGFGTHGHDNMEIVSWIVSGGLTHQDSMGSRKTVEPGAVQYMSAGSGVRHSEFNASSSNEVHFLQIWILPNEKDAPPRYEDRDFTNALASGGLVLVASRDGRDGSIAIRADADMYVARMAADAKSSHTSAPGRAMWLQVVKGALRANGTSLEAGDGLAFAETENTVELEASADAEVLLFELGA